LSVSARLCLFLSPQLSRVAVAMVRTRIYLVECN